jgi:cellulose synthase/poly-beta-1,6-N-acetylglucosamine synthase-like glycosyltransferase
VQSVWIRVALAAIAGLGSLAVCCGAFVAIVALLFSGGDLAIIPLYLRSQAVYWIGLVTAVLFAGAGLSLPTLALGARWWDALKPAVLSSPVFGAFVFFFLLSLDSRYGFVAGAISLMALVGTPVTGSLVTLQEEEGHSVAVRLGRVTVIVAVTIYCASLLAYSLYWLGAADLSSFLTPYVVAAFSWLVLPAMVAKLRFS